MLFSKHPSEKTNEIRNINFTKMRHTKRHHHKKVRHHKKKKHVGAGVRRRHHHKHSRHHKGRRGGNIWDDIKGGIGDALDIANKAAPLIKLAAM